MGEMMVQFAGMQAAVTDMERSITRLQTAIDTLEGDLRPLVATWTGEAALFYQERQRAWDAAFTELQGVLVTAKQTVGQAADNYQRTEAANAALWRA
jgi:6 kDa early secretory antigenic target